MWWIVFFFTVFLLGGFFLNLLVLFGSELIDNMLSFFFSSSEEAGEISVWKLLLASLICSIPSGIELILSIFVDTLSFVSGGRIPEWEFVWAPRFLVRVLLFFQKFQKKED